MIEILLADDEQNIRDIVSWYLESEGFTVYSAADGNVAMEIETKHQPDLLILDIMMPGVSGWEVAKMIERQVPIIFLTARGHEEDKIASFSLGADDYITKPFSPRELVARVKAVLRRCGKITEQSNVIELPDLYIDPGNQCTKVNNVRVMLSTKEFELLYFLARQPQCIFTRNQLLLNIWGYDFDGYDRTVDTTIKRIRKKLGTGKKYVSTIRGKGYKFEVDSL